MSSFGFSFGRSPFGVSEIMKRRVRELVVTAVLGMVVTTGVRADDSGNSEDVGQYLGAVYKDEVAGIKIAPPVGSRIINRAGLDLVTYVNDTKQWGGSVRMVITKQKMTVEGYLSSTAAELGRTVRAVQVLDSRELTFQTRAAGRLTTSMQAEVGGTPGAGGKGGSSKAEVVALFRQQLVVQMGDTSFMLVTLDTPLKDREDAATTFDAMLGTFEILDRVEVGKRLEAAVLLGKKWLSQRSSEEMKQKLVTDPQLFRMKANGADVGFLQFNESQTSRDNTQGVRVLVTSRAFNPEGSNVSGQYDAYWSFTGEDSAKHLVNYSEWSNTTKTVLNKPGVPLPNQTFWLQEVGTIQLEGGSAFTAQELAELTRQRDEIMKKNLPADKIPPAIVVLPKVSHIHVAYDGDSTQPPLQPTDAFIKEDRPAVLPAVLGYLWPRVVDLKTKAEMTFVVYSSNKKKLTYRTLSTRGADHVVINKKPVDCFRCEDEMDSASTTLWVDEAGKILMMRTSDQSLLVPTTDEEMRRQWAGRINQPH